MSIDGVDFKTISGSIDLGPTQSLQLMFAKLQLVMAEQSKTQAMAYMDEITTSQEKSKEVAEMIQKCRELQSQAKEKNGEKCYVHKETGEVVSGDGLSKDEKKNYVECKKDQTPIPADIKKFMEENGLSVSSANDGWVFNSDQWDFNITSLRNYQEQIGANTQQQMVFIQDFMGQYNSYLQGANSAIQQSNQTLSTLAKGQ